MSNCSAEEIAERKRIAIERLKARKNQLASAGATSDAGSKSNVGANSNNLANSIEKLPEKPAQSFYKPPVNVSNTKTPRENKASEFLRALKQSSVLSNRLEARAAAQPYQLPVLMTRNQDYQQQHSNSIKNTPLSSPKQQIAPIFNNAVSCNIYMISNVRFAVCPSSYHAKLIEVFKTIPSKSYDNNTKIWTFALKDYQLVQERVAHLKPNVVIGTIPKGVLYLCQSPVKEPDTSCLTSINSKMVDKLLPFQKDGVCFAISQHGRLMICDEMGLGKTYQALAVADFYKEDWPLFICTNASTRDSWASHVRELLPFVPCHNILVLTTNQQYFGDAKILITSYNLMERNAEKLLEKKFGFLIFDESHALKNSKAKCTIVADRLSVNAKRILLLSGTPALSRPLELFTQLHMIDRKFMNFIEFTSRYCAGKQTNFGWDATGQSNLQELNVVLKLKYMLRRVKADVLPQLAEKFRETVVLDPSLIWTSNNTKENLTKFAADLSVSKGREKEELLLRYYAETAEVKTRAVCDYLKTLVKEKVKFIVFAHHKVMMDAICAGLDQLKVNFVRIDGSTRNDIRTQYIDTFQNKSSCMVAVLSLKACNSGITLTAAETIVFAELDWNPSTLAQAESRAHRIGQQKPVICRYLLATKTADDVIWNMLKSKQDVLNRAGLFCENLQEATHTSAPLSTKSIQQYFPTENSKTSGAGGISEEAKDQTANELLENAKVQSISSNTMELGAIKDSIDIFFDDDEEDAFKDLKY